MAIHAHRRIGSLHSMRQRRKAKEQKRENIVQTQPIIEQNIKSAKNTAINTENSLQTKQTKQNPFMQHIDNTVNQTKHDYDRVVDIFEKEGATPAVLDGISGTANIGKNTIKTVSAATDTIFEYTKTGQQGFDNIVSDGIGKTTSGVIGTGAELIATAGSLFSTEEGSTTKAIKNLGEEAAKVGKGGGNLLLGIVGKGWIWGSDDDNKKAEQPVKEEKAVPAEKPEPVNLLHELARETFELKQEPTQAVQPVVQDTPKADVVPVKDNSAASDTIQPLIDKKTDDLNDKDTDILSKLDFSKLPIQQDVIDALEYFENEAKSNAEVHPVEPKKNEEKGVSIKDESTVTPTKEPAEDTTLSFDTIDPDTLKLPIQQDVIDALEYFEEMEKEEKKLR